MLALANTTAPPNDSVDVGLPQGKTKRNSPPSKATAEGS